MLKDNKRKGDPTISDRLLCITTKAPCARHEADLSLTDFVDLVDICGVQAIITIETKGLGDYRQPEVMTDFGSS